MIEFKKKPDKEEDIYNILHPYVKKWFKQKFKNFAAPQQYSVLEIHSRNNILVSAPTGSGKCITPDSTILLNIGGETKLLTGEELIKLSKEGKLISRVDKSGKLYDVPNLQSYSLYQNQVKKTKAMVYFENYKGKIYNVKTEYGREIRLSPDHPLLIEREGHEEWIPVKEIKKGEKIAVPIKIDLPEKEISLNYKKAIENLRKNSDIVIDYSDYLRLKNKTERFTKFEKLNSKELYEIKTLLKTSFNELCDELSVNLTTTFRLFNKHSKYKEKELFTLLKNN